jgi:hypothetical protein
MALRVNDYLIIETWNGEGYSYENDAAIFKTDDTAKRIAHNSLKSVLGYFSIGEGCGEDGLDINYNKIGKEYKITYTFEDNNGSISVLPYQGQYGVMIKCEINEYTIFNTKEEYDKAYQEAVELADPEDYQLGDMFIHACKDDYSRQFKILRP